MSCGGRVVLCRRSNLCSRLLVPLCLLATLTGVFIGQRLPGFYIHVDSTFRKADIKAIIEPKLKDIQIPDVQKIVQVQKLHQTVNVNITVNNIQCPEVSTEEIVLDPLKGHPGMLSISIGGIDVKCTADFRAAPDKFLWPVAGKVSMHIEKSSAYAEVWVADPTGDLHLIVKTCDADLTFAPGENGLLFEKSHLSWALNTDFARGKLEEELISVLSPEICGAVDKLTNSPTDGKTPKDASTTNHVLVSTTSFSVWEGISKLFEINEYALAIVLLCFSGIWPFIKHGLLFLVWFCPLKPGAISALIGFVDIVGKWSMIDVFFVIIVAFCLTTTEYTLVTATIKVTLGPGVYAYSTAIVGSMVITTFMRGAAQRMVNIEERLRAPVTLESDGFRSIEPGPRSRQPTRNIRQAARSEPTVLYGEEEEQEKAPEGATPPGTAENAFAHSLLRSFSMQDEDALEAPVSAADVECPPEPLPSAMMEDDLCSEEESPQALMARPRTTRPTKSWRMRVISYQLFRMRASILGTLIFSFFVLCALFAIILGLIQPMFVLRRAIRITILGTTVGPESLFSLSVFSTLKSLSKESSEIGLVIFMAFCLSFVPILKWVYILLLWLTWPLWPSESPALRGPLSDWEVEDRFNNTRYSSTVGRLMHAICFSMSWDMREVFLVTLFILANRIHPMMKNISNNYADFDVHVLGVGMWGTAISIGIEYATFFFAHRAVAVANYRR